MLKTLSRQQLEDALRLATTKPKPSRRDVLAGNSELDRILDAIANPCRRLIFDAVRGQPASATEIAKSIGLPASNFSRHLAKLRSACLVDLVASAADRRERIVSPRLETLEKLRAWIDQTDIT